MLTRTGARCWRIGFNRGDEVSWTDRASYIPYRGTPEDWPDVLARTLEAKAITDIVLYGDTRPIHAEAVRLAAARSVEVHVFEEGYLRPNWVTYERGGANGHSPLMSTSVTQMRSTLTESQAEMPVSPAHWGDMREHVWYGALYHAAILFGNRRYAGFRPHRALSVRQESSASTSRGSCSPRPLGRPGGCHETREAGRLSLPPRAAAART